MSYSSPLGRLPVKRRKNIKDPPVKIPEVLKLPDGREFVLAELLKGRTRAVQYNLRSRRRNQELKPIQRARTSKYTIDDRIWQSQAELAELEERYQITTTQAKSMRYQATEIVRMLERTGLIDSRPGDEDSCIITEIDRA